MAKKFATFDEEGRLLLRFDSAVNMIPDGAIEIQAELWARMVSETDGVWSRLDGVITKQPLPPPSTGVLGMSERVWRNAAVASTEWLMNRHRDELDMQLATTLSAEQFAELLVYRQVLRNWPQSEAFPDAEQRPVAPAFLSALESVE
ncbi:phage tail assembly chaperone [Pseudomonas guariconensis]|uniref:phage tail assembly chaperone n=1 Tax=Pseudomonas guariconensis TaxID=1288410 RepID=UPI002B0596B7|nr:phage tail assembly chaperone [Pseudomonas guariconensis]